MNERLLKLLNCQEELNKGLSTYIEAFVDFYGEEKKSEIEEAFKNAMYIGYQTPDQIFLTLNKIEDNTSNELITKILLENKTNLTKEDLFQNYSFKYETLMPIHKYREFYDLYKLTEEQRLKLFIDNGYNLIKMYLPSLTSEEFISICDSKTIPLKYQNLPAWIKNEIEYYFDSSNCQKEYLEKFNKTKELLQKIDSSIDESNFEEKLKDTKFQQLKELLEIYLIQKEEYTSYMEKFSKYYEYIEKTNHLKHVLMNKYYQMFIKENIDLIPLDKRTGLEEFFTDSTKEYNLDPYIKFLFGFSLIGSCGLDCFKEEKTKELEKGDTNSWSVEETKKARIKYFNMNGINLSGSYEDYIDNPEVKKIWPDEQRVKRFFEIRDTLINDFNIEYFNSISTNKEIREMINSLNLLDKEDCFNAKLYETSGACVNPNVILKNNYYSLYSLVIVNFNLYDIDSMDQKIIHELNHLYELFLEYVDGNDYSIICGWDYFTGKINQDKIEPIDTLNVDNSKREYELYSEIINELIAKDICRKMYQKGNYVFGNPHEHKIYNSTSYDSSSFLAKDFYHEFKDVIIKSRRNGNIQIILNEVGKDNFDDLNSLFAIFNEHFGGMKFYNLVSSLNSNQETEQTKIYYDLVKQRDEILKKMRCYSSMKNKNVNSI